MKAFTKYLAGGAGLAAMAAAAPAAAQYGGIPIRAAATAIPAAVRQATSSARSWTRSSAAAAMRPNDRNAVEQCVRAVEYRINTRGLDNEGGRYRQYGYGYGYNNRLQQRLMPAPA